MRKDTIIVETIIDQIIVNEQKTIEILEVGLQGPAGVNGTGDKTYVHTQGVASTSWNVTHNLGKYPAITVMDSAGTEIIGDVIHMNVNNVVLSFSAIFSGTATFN